jgi:uncharacterized protein (TIGR03437 family)
VWKCAGARSASRILSLLAVAAAITCATGFAQVLANPFLDDSTVQVINLTMDPSDWATLQQNYLLDTYYHATFVWNGISEDIGIRSHGGGSRSPVKPNLDLNFAHYTKTQTFLGLPFVLLKANNEDPSNLREWISMKLYRKMGIPAPREAPAQVFINGQLLGFYYIVEHLDTTFLQRDFGESGGYLYEWQSVGGTYYDFGNLGTDPTLYAQFLDLKTDQATPDLQTFENLVQVINQPPSATFTNAAFIAALSQYLDPKQFLTYGAIEQVLSGSDSLIGGQQGMNNFDLYQFQGTTVYYFIPWDKDMTFSDATRDIMDGISNGPNINLLAARLAGIPQYLQVYLNAAVEAANLMGSTGGWADLELTREFDVIQAAALDDPNRPCGDMITICGNPDFETSVQGLHQLLITRSSFVLSEAVSDGWQASTAGPQVAAAGITGLSGYPELSPGGLAYVQGTGLAAAAQAGATPPWPRVLGNAYVAVEGVRAPLFSTADGNIEFQAPGDIPVGDASVVVSNNGDMSYAVDMDMQASTPAVLTVTNADGSAVTAAETPVAGKAIVLYATGLGAVNGNLAVGAAAPAAPALSTVVLPQVVLGGVPLTVTFSGLAPGLVGMYQVNASVPANAAALSTSGQGAYTGPLVALTINGQTATWQPPQ